MCARTPPKISKQQTNMTKRELLRATLFACALALAGCATPRDIVYLQDGIRRETKRLLCNNPNEQK